MKHDFNWKALKEEEVTISYNMGLEMAVFVLEMAEGLSPEGRKHLLDLLKKNISKGNGRYKSCLTEYISGNNANPNHKTDKE